MWPWQCQIVSGTKVRLVNALADEAPQDTVYVQHFLLTYRFFMRPFELLELVGTVESH